MKHYDRLFWMNAVFAAFIIGILVYASIVYAPEITRLVSHPKEFRDFILSYGRLGAAVFMLFQVIQVVIAIIPGEVVEIAGGYIFGTFRGTVYSAVGITVGYLLVFAMVRLFGFRLVKQMVSEDTLQKFFRLINSPGSEMTLFILFIIPGIPKDILVYIAGLTPVKPVQFFIITTIARLPSMLGASYIGSNIQKENYNIAIIISVISCILFVAGYIYKDRIISAMKNMVHARKEK